MREFTIPETRRTELMREAIAEAKKSVNDDPGTHPLVGAVLADSAGQVLHKAHRGMSGLGDHAEFALLKAADDAGTVLSNTVLFVTLEPCTRRGPGKVPCAARIVESGISQIFIGTLDPNRHICGSGEMFLAGYMTVDRFPSTLARELMSLNAEFFAKHMHEHIPAVSIYASSGGNLAEVPEAVLRLSGQREGLLLQSTSLIAGSHGEVCIMAGDLSWLREIQPVIVLAGLEGRRVRILLMVGPEPKPDVQRMAHIAGSLGAEVGIANTALAMRGTLVSPGTGSDTMLLVEKEPALHGTLFRRPHENGVLDAVGSLFGRLWGDSVITPASTPSFQQVSMSDAVGALREGVPQYAKAQIEQQKVAPEDVLPLPSQLERLKLFRLAQLAVLESRFGWQTPGVIKGSPWPLMPVIVERLPDGKMIVVDGAHRVYSALMRGISELEVLLVSEVDGDLPGVPRLSWDEVRVGTVKLPRPNRYTNYRDECFRPICDAFGQLSVGD